MTTYQDMSQKESMRKLQQLRPVLESETQHRIFLADTIKDTELGGLMLDNGLDHCHLVPFLVTAVQYLDDRVRALEQQLAAK